MAPSTTHQNDFAPLLYWVAGAGAFLTGACAVVFGLGEAGSVALGSGFALVNLWVIARVVGVLLQSQGRRVFWTLIGMLKLVGAAGLLYVAFTRGWASPLWFGLGYGALPIGIILAQGFASADRSLTAKES